MSCPLLRRTPTSQCRAVSEAPVPIGREVTAAYCRGQYGSCPAYRYLRAAGRPLHPADFRAWVVEGISPGRVDAPAYPAHGTDGA